MASNNVGWCTTNMFDPFDRTFRSMMLDDHVSWQIQIIQYVGSTYHATLLYTQYVGSVMLNDIRTSFVADSDHPVSGQQIANNTLFKKATRCDIKQIKENSV